MGALARGTRSARPPGFGEPPSRPLEYGTGSPARLWLGVFAGVLVGIAVVVTIAFLGPAIPLRVRGAVLGALSGVLLTPVLALGSFVLMLVGPFSLGGILGDSLWTRLARANTERRFGPLIIPLLFFLVLPMVLCGLGGSKMQVIGTPVLMSAGLGAVMLGAVVGGLCGGRGGKIQ
jgi:hypothetical protein